MHRFTVSLLAISFCLILLCACGREDAIVDNTPISPQLYFTATADISSEDMNMTADITSDVDQTVKIILTSPDSVKGITYELSYEKLVISRNLLKCVTSTDYLPSFSAEQVIFDTLTSAFKSPPKYDISADKEDVYVGRNTMGNYIIKTDSDTGFITAIQPSYVDINVTLSNFKPLSK